LQVDQLKLQWWSIPTVLTVVRLALIPFFVVFFYIPWDWGRTIAATIFGIAAVTDWLDGYLARYLAQRTSFGAFLDPVVDKLMVAIALVMIVGDRDLPFLAVPALVIVGREIVISALREWMAELGRRTSIAVTMVGKAKTLMQMVALILLLAYRPEWPNGVVYLGSVLLYTAALLTLWSMTMYLKSARDELT